MFRVPAVDICPYVQDGTADEHIHAKLAGSHAGRRTDAAPREGARILQPHR